MCNINKFFLNPQQKIAFNIADVVFFVLYCVLEALTLDKI